MSPRLAIVRSWARRSLIIDRSGIRPVWTGPLELVLSALMWLVYLYFIREALGDLYHLLGELFAWMVYAGSAPPSLPTAYGIFGTLEKYGAVIVANGALLIGWALYNQIRYGGPDRRHEGDPVTVAELAELYGYPAAEVTRWQQSRVVTIRHEADGTLAAVSSTGLALPQMKGVGTARPPSGSNNDNTPVARAGG